MLGLIYFFDFITRQFKFDCMDDSNAPQEIFKGRTVKALLHFKDLFIEITYTGSPTSSEEYKDVCNTALNYAIQYNVHKWFIDQVLMNVHPNEINWLFTDWVPRLIKALGEKRTTATVLSKNLFGEFVTKQQISKNTLESHGNANAGFFKSREEALEWLLNDESNKIY